MIARPHSVHLFRKIRLAVLVIALAVCQAVIGFELSAQPPGANFVRFAWSGAVTSESAVVKAKVVGTGSNVRLVVSEASDFSQPTSVAPSNPGANVLSFELSGLKPDTAYYYVVDSNGTRDTGKSGRLRTFPSGPASFQIAFGSCADTASDHPVFDTIRGLSPLFFLHMGDFHYEDIKKNDPKLFQQTYEAVLTSSRQGRLYREIPIAYVWDDHDFGGNNSDSTAKSRPAVRTTYQEYVPHYPLAAGCCDVPIYQSFLVGRVYFILTDQRSERTPATKQDNAQKSVLGTAQKAWLKKELLKGADYPLVVWVGTAPWIESKTQGSDRWGGYSTERQEIADFIKSNKINNLVMLSGDAHMVALDDGTNSEGGFPVLHAAALDRTGSEKGGPYSHGTFPSRTKSGEHDGQFGVLTVTDTGGPETCIEFSGRRQEYRTSQVVELLKPWKKCFPTPAAPPN